jgi:hypothetical protein
MTGQVVENSLGKNELKNLRLFNAQSSIEAEHVLENYNDYEF